ncbi:MAG: nuclear transport factor 2 family protein [Candidatus Latescibacteria bacterium]|nr:nuclear transport factor 2 family protein [Candidatus Latescibacterota bacterium]
MIRNVLIISLLTVCFASMSVFAQETSDEKAVRAVIESELKGALEGKPEQMKACYSSDFIGFSGWNRGNFTMHKLHNDGEVYYYDPEDWQVTITTSRELDEYAENFRDYPERIKKSAMTRGNEVVSVNVKNNGAIAVTRHWGTWYDKTTNENVRFEGRSVWMLRKESGEWKIFSNIGHVAIGMMATKALPQ